MAREKKRIVVWAVYIDGEFYSAEATRKGAEWIAHECGQGSWRDIRIHKTELIPPKKVRARK